MRAPGQYPASTEGNGEAHAGGRAVGAEPEANDTVGAGVEEAGAEGLWPTGEYMYRSRCCKCWSRT